MTTVSLRFDDNTKKELDEMCAEMGMNLTTFFMIYAKKALRERSIPFAIVELGVEEVMVIGHTDCGVQGMNGTELLEDLTKRGVKQEHIDIIRHSGVDLETWLGGFESVEQSVEDTVYALQNHPLMPKDVTIRGFIMNSETGELSAVK